ncbi:flagellar motor switch protein FliN [Salinarimonas chemoclinalis]|uniref:flagellar motor switch protein FliN n=1 Tax=Salinarimonas chemoclinalis TaxID=3241599 RepID=UPI003555FCFE
MPVKKTTAKPADLAADFGADASETEAHETIDLGKDASGRTRTGETAADTIGLGRAHGNLDAIMRIPVSLQVVLGSATMPVANLMKLGRGAVVPLDHRVGEPVDVVVNGRVVARGEVVVVEDDNSRFGVSLTEIVGTPTPGA